MNDLFLASTKPIGIRLRILVRDGELVPLTVELFEILYKDSKINEVNLTANIEGKEYKVYDETAEFEYPSWKKSMKVEYLSTVNGMLLSDKLEYNRLAYFLKKTSLFEVKLAKDAEGDEFVSNLNEFVDKFNLKIINVLVAAFVNSI